MRPTGIVLIAIYHFLTAAFLVCLAIALAVGGSVLGAMFAAGNSFPLGGMGFFVGVMGATLMLALPWSPRLPATASGPCASGDAFCASCWPASPFCFRSLGCYSLAFTSDSS